MITTVGCVGDISGSKGDDLRNLPLPVLKAEIGRIYEVAIAGPGKEREMCMPMPLLVCALCYTVTNHSWLSKSCAVGVAHLIGVNPTLRTQIARDHALCQCLVLLLLAPALERLHMRGSCFKASVSCFDVCT
jgi:hypothetical protein